MCVCIGMNFYMYNTHTKIVPERNFEDGDRSADGGRTHDEQTRDR